MAVSALVLADIEHAYGDRLALRRCSFDLPEGQILCLLGPSGCGKTTALRVAAGLESPRRGTVHLAGRLVTGPGRFVPPEERDIGLLFQDFALFPHLSVEQNVAFGLKRMAVSERRRRVMEMLEWVGMTRLWRAYPHMLSGGEQQRIALARALAPRPRVLLLDEPFSDLDSRLRRQVRDTTLHLLKGFGVSVLLVTHDPEEALYMGDRIALMEQGRIAQAGDAVELYYRPATRFVAEFFGEVNRIASRVEDGAVPSPFGRLPNPGIAEGTPVTLLIRAEALTLHATAKDGAPTPHATVETARLLGRTSLVHLRTHPETGFDVHLHATVPGSFLPAPGSLLWIEIDPRLAFVFPD